MLGLRGANGGRGGGRGDAAPSPAHLGFLLQRQALDGDEAVGLGVADHHPPALLAFLRGKRRVKGCQGGTIPSLVYTACRSGTHLGEEGSDDGAGDLLLTLQLHQHHHGPPAAWREARNTVRASPGLTQHRAAAPPTLPASPSDAFLLHHLVGQLDVGVAVAEAGDVGDLGVGELQQRVAVLVLHLHDVEDALDPL